MKWSSRLSRFSWREPVSTFEVRHTSVISRKWRTKVVGKYPTAKTTSIPNREGVRRYLLWRQGEGVGQIMILSCPAIRWTIGGSGIWRRTTAGHKHFHNPFGESERAMHLTERELWTAVHGMVFGAGFLLLFSAMFMAIWSLGSANPSDPSTDRYLRRLVVGSWLMTLFLWAAVILGTYWIYPWYRAKPPANATSIALAGYPKFLLIASKETEGWHEFGMEWKEHIAWLAPILATAVTCILTFHGRSLIGDALLRRVALFLFTVAFLSASVAGAMGAMINKFAPTR
jgi:hypothetical protein